MSTSIQIIENEALGTIIKNDENQNFWKRKCPKCGSDRVIPIIYGDIDGSPEVMQQIKNEEIESGGCCVDNDSPKWKYRDCEERFGKIDWT